MEKKTVTRLMHLALILITISLVQVCSIALAEANSPPGTPSTPSGSTSISSGTYYSYITKANDLDGNQVKYTFDWGDGTASATCFVDQGIAVRISHKWNVASGSTKAFSVRAKATDRSGAVSSWSGALSVTAGNVGSSTTTTTTIPSNNPPATPSIPSGSTSGTSGTSYSYSARTTDPDGNQVKYMFDWGDGSSYTTSSQVGSGVPASVSHIWTVASGTTKTFSVRAKAIDEKGTASIWSSPLSVTIKGPATVINTDGTRAPATPSIPSGDLTGKSGITYTYSTKANDPDMNKVKFTFNWGDGTTSTTSLVSSGSYARASHSWSIEPGSIKTFNVAAKATNERGIDSKWSNPCPVSIIADKVNHPPAIPSIPTGPISLESGESGTFSTSSTDPDGDMLKYIFDWGDGSTQTDFFPSGQKVTASHRWNVPAGSTRSYKVRAICADTRYLTSRDPYWSAPLIVNVYGPSTYAVKLGLRADGNETIYMDMERTNYVDTQNNESESKDEQAEEPELLDEQTSESESKDEQAEETKLLDGQTSESESLDEQAEGGCPSVADDFYSISSANNFTIISDPGVLENDQCGEEKSLSIVSHTQPAHAADFAINPDGSFTYTATQDYCGVDSFTYRATDGDCESNEASVTIFIDCNLEDIEEMLY